MAVYVEEGVRSTEVESKALADSFLQADIPSDSLVKKLLGNSYSVTKIIQNNPKALLKQTESGATLLSAVFSKPALDLSDLLNIVQMVESGVFSTREILDASRILTEYKCPSEEEDLKTLWSSAQNEKEASSAASTSENASLKRAAEKYMKSRAVSMDNFSIKLRNLDFIWELMKKEKVKPDGLTVDDRVEIWEQLQHVVLSKNKEILDRFSCRDAVVQKIQRLGFASLLFPLLVMGHGNLPKVDRYESRFYEKRQRGHVSSRMDRGLFLQAR